MLCRYLTTFKSTAGRAPANTVQLISRCHTISRLDGMKFFKTTQICGWAVLLQLRPSFFHGVEDFFRLGVMQPFKTVQVYGWAVLPTSPVTAQLISRRWKVFRFMQIVNNVQIKSGSCSPKHGPAHFTVLKTIFVCMVLSFSKTLDFMAVPCSPKHGPVSFTVLKILFVCSYADCQQRSIEQLVVLPQTRFSSFHGVEAFVRLDRMKLFKYHQISGWAVLISARPSVF